MIRMTLNVVPVGQMRARACVRGKHAGTYKAKEQEQREQTLSSVLEPYQPSEPMDGPLVLAVDCMMPIPASWSKRKRQQAKDGLIRPDKTPDADNLAKHLKDVMGQLRFWIDDKQVVDLHVRKWYSDLPRWEVRLERYTPLYLNFRARVSPDQMPLEHSSKEAA